MRFTRQLFYSLGILKEPTLVGIWERTGDDFSGCRLRIEYDGPNLNGRIVRLPDHMAKFGWQQDDAKWIHIQRQAVCRYQLEELYKVLSSRTKPARNLYHRSKLLIQSNVELMIIPPKVSGGRKNRWRRVNDCPKGLSTRDKTAFYAPSYPPARNSQKRR
ncbi:MAG: hypothetical protein PVI54_19190 [Desulfobacteraceae bacterium]